MLNLFQFRYSRVAREHPNHKTKHQNQHQCSSLFHNSFVKTIFSYSFLKSSWNKLKKKLYFTTLNYALDYTLHPKLSECALCTLIYYTYHTLHPGVTFAIVFDRILLHVLGTCFLLRWNKFKSLKHHFSKSIKTKAIFFQISCLACVPLPTFGFFSKPQVPPTQLTHCPKREKKLKFSFFGLSLARKIHERKRR